MNFENFIEHFLFAHYKKTTPLLEIFVKAKTILQKSGIVESFIPEKLNKIESFVKYSSLDYVGVQNFKIKIRICKR